MYYTRQVSLLPRRQHEIKRTIGLSACWEILRLNFPVAGRAGVEVDMRHRPSSIQAREVGLEAICARTIREDRADMVVIVLPVKSGQPVDYLGTHDGRAIAARPDHPRHHVPFAHGRSLRAVRRGVAVAPSVRGWSARLCGGGGRGKSR